MCCCAASELMRAVQDNNGIADEGAKAIASALKENRTVRELRLVRLFVRPTFCECCAVVLRESQRVCCRTETASATRAR